MLNVVRENDNEELNEKYMEDIKFYLMSITKKNKKELHKFMDNIEKKIKKNYINSWIILKKKLKSKNYLFRFKIKMFIINIINYLL